MKIKVLAFGIAKDILGASWREIEVEKGGRVAGVKDALEAQYPGLKNLLSYAIAVNNEYAGESREITESDEIAIIPPVSGG